MFCIASGNLQNVLIQALSYFFWTYVNFILSSQRAFVNVLCQKLSFLCFFNYKIFDISPILCWWWNISQGNFELFPCKKSNCSWLRFPFSIDCFATRENRMCKRFYSAAWEYECEAVNFFGKGSLLKKYAGSFLTLDLQRRRLDIWQTVEPVEWCSSSACPPCLGSSGSSMVGKSLDSSRTTTGSSLLGFLLLELKVPSAGDQLGRKSS